MLVLTTTHCCVEGGSAGDAYAQTVKASEIISTDAQINAFTEVKSGAVDYIVVDIVLAQNVCGKGNYTDLSIVSDIQLDSEIYAVGFKKNTNLDDVFTYALAKVYKSGKALEIAEKYGLKDVLVDPFGGNIDEIIASFQFPTDGQWKEIKDEGKVIVGYTIFAPMNYIEAD